MIQDRVSWTEIAAPEYEAHDAAAKGLPRSGQYGQNCNVLQLAVDGLHLAVARETRIRCLHGRIVVEMLPELTHHGILGLPDEVGGACRPDIGVVLASRAQDKENAEEPPPPGTLVGVRPYDGTWIDGAELGLGDGELGRAAQATSGQIRIYGAFKEYERPEAADWWDSVVAAIEVSDGRIRLRGFVDKIVLKLDPIEQTDGGLILADLSQYRNGLATVVSVGSKVKDLAAGERVSYDVEMLLQTGLGLDLVDDRDYAICTALAINYVLP